MKKRLHVICFDNPYPPKYGGIIDVYYKIKALSELEVGVYLHVFGKQNIEEEKELSKYCETVFYYPRNNVFLSLFSLIPFRVKSRSSKLLEENLIKIKAPILYEGLHTTYSLFSNNLKNNYVRTHNVEHAYFYGLAKSERNLVKKIFYLIEGKKLERFEKQLEKATTIFTISKIEQQYFQHQFKEKAIYVPAFHDATFLMHKETRGSYILWHGDLRVPDNIKSVLFLIEVYKDSKFNFKIASSTINTAINKKISKINSIEFIDLNKKVNLFQLINEAHINVLYTFQATGIKLKLLNALYKGKFVLGNDLLIENTGLKTICEIANTESEFLKQTEDLFKKEFTTAIVEKRKEVLNFFSPELSAKKIKETIFPH